jgi:hypothetical protein
MNKLYHKLRRSIQTMMIYFYRTAQSDYEKSVYERDCTCICKKLIYQKETTLLLTPKTGKRYIKNEDSSVFIILDSHRVKIINHVYAYDVHFTEKGWNQLIDIKLLIYYIICIIIIKHLELIRTHFNTWTI